MEKVYKVYRGEVVSLSVIKETKKLIYVERHKAFGYGVQLTKDYVCATPQEAVQEELNSALSAVGAFSDRLKKAESRLLYAKGLCAEYGV